MWKIYKNNASDLNFAISCLYNQAVNLDEFKQWVELVINDLESDEIPLFMFDLLFFNDSLFKIYDVIGFEFNNDLSKEEDYALYYIAYERFKVLYDPCVSKDDAIIALNKHPYILDKYKKMFPFIKLDF
ncbi:MULTISPECIES: hypothetical protein [Rodentibacter]|uniref:hypothetical protein n=1 Tax=Rodentibacter TaxID=1960084 RepID=UPI001CFD5A4F|nr:hypothetical protein [Rodentibacter sp. JRC1]GJI55698.1 hypothetical protein HEMROJRC1_08100 [Rodentibacter sp. JRC1]